MTRSFFPLTLFSEPRTLFSNTKQEFMSQSEAKVENPFGEWLKSRREAKKWSVRKLAAEAKVCSSGYISQLENNTYTTKKGKPTQVDEDIVSGLAAALGANVDEALTLAGYAKRDDHPARSESGKPKSFAEFAAALEEMGVFDLQMFGGEGVFDEFTEFDYELFLEKMRSDVLHEVKRKGMAK